METTATRIRNAIVSGELPLGSKLSEQRLADSLQVSRSPVRDALAALQSEGLVHVSPKRGTFVFTPDLRVVDELCEHRAVLEVAALRKAIIGNHTVLLSTLERAIAEMQRALETDDAHGYTAGDQEFHKAIVASCENRSIIRSYSHTIGPLKALRTHLFTIMLEGAERSMAEHMALLAACQEQNTDRAVDLLTTHVGHLAEAFRAKLETESAS
ncbi:MAG: GntR family transcriptional regulator [Pelagimonas sp.]|uniref:GntR family transcriptional regulator n=1 Tax=Pelagimonas sp. TaxID=2073170 RepID=UPI003D6A5253